MMDLLVVVEFIICLPFMWVYAKIARKNMYDVTSIAGRKIGYIHSCVGSFVKTFVKKS